MRFFKDGVDTSIIKLILYLFTEVFTGVAERSEHPVSSLAVCNFDNLLVCFTFVRVHFKLTEIPLWKAKSSIVE